METTFEDSYHRVEDHHWWFVGRRDLLSALVRDTLTDPGGRILDVGCAGGATLHRLQQDGYRNVVGIDISAEAIGRCRRRGLTEVHVMDGQSPDFPAGSFDVILASDVLEHVPDERAALNAWFRLLRPDGVLITLVPAFMALWGPHDEANQHRKRYRLAELQRALDACGFVTRRASYWNFLLFLPAALVRTAQRVLPAPRSPLELRPPIAPLNHLLRLSLLAENRALQRGLSWPWGLSALVIARRPAATACRDATP